MRKTAAGLGGVLLLLFCTSIHSHDVDAAHDKETLISHEAKLLKHLFEDHPYDKYARPVYNFSDTVSVSLGATLVQIVDLDEKSQILTTSMFVQKSWTDIQLTWNPSDFGGIDALRVPISKLWIPDIVLYNTASERYSYVFESLALVYSSGYVLWIPHYMLKSYCKLDMSRFPFDKQTCSLKFGSWTYDAKLVNISAAPSSTDVSEQYIVKGEWKVTEYTAERNEMIYPCCPESYPDVTFTIGIERVSIYHRYMFLFPCIMLCILTMFLFVLPPESGEKVNLGIGIVLAYVFMLLMLENYLPTELNHVPMIGVYYCFNLVMVVSSIIISMFVLNICVRGPRRGSAPAWLKSMVRGKLGAICCVKDESYAPLLVFQHDEADEGHLVGDIVTNHGDEMTDVQTTKLERTLNEILKHLRSKGEQEKPSREMIMKNDWYKAALMIDRIALALYIIICIVGTICIIL